MDAWAVAGVTLFLSLALAAVLWRRRGGLPPGPLALPILGNLEWLTLKEMNFESILGGIWKKYGPVVTIQVGTLRMIIVGDRDLAHKMLIQHGAVFADRPAASALGWLAFNYPVVGTTRYGPLWRLLRRNLAMEMLSPSRLRQFADARKRVLGILIDMLRVRATSGDGVVLVREALHYSVFSLLAFLCFGEKLEEGAAREMEAERTELLSLYPKIAIFEMAPKVAPYIFRGRRNRLLQVLQRQRDIIFPLIQTRRHQKQSNVSGENISRFSYLDSLLDMEIPEDNGRKLNDEEIMYLCGEFLDAGTDSMSTAMEWIMANLVKHPMVQERLAQEVGTKTTEEDLQNIPYLKAVVLEGLRRHPPAPLVVQHATTEEISLGGYTIPKGTSINYGVAKMNLDGETWLDPLEFRPERFLPGGEGEGVDLTGSKKIQMMPFGVGRRICPGMGLALLHLEYFVGNLVRTFRWEAADGGEVDLSGKPVFTVVMKNPLRARIFQRDMQ